MCWHKMRMCYPNQWIMIEAIERKTINAIRIIHTVDFVKAFDSDFTSAFSFYLRWLSDHPDNEYYFIHTSRSDLHIHEQEWVELKALASNFVA